MFLLNLWEENFISVLIFYALKLSNVTSKYRSLLPRSLRLKIQSSNSFLSPAYFPPQTFALPSYYENVGNWTVQW